MTNYLLLNEFTYNHTTSNNFIWVVKDKSSLYLETTIAEDASADNWINLQSQGDYLFRRNDTSIYNWIQKSIETLSKQNVIIEDLDKNLPYLLHYPEIINLIIEACEEIRKIFSQQSQITMSFFSEEDINIANSYPLLTISLNEYPDNTYEILHKIKESFYRKIGKEKGYFHITTNFESL